MASNMLKVPLAPPHKIIEVATLEADEKGVRVMSLGLMNNVRSLSIVKSSYI